MRADNAAHKSVQKNLELLLLGPLCEEAVKVLSNGAQVSLCVEGKDYSFLKEKGKARIYATDKGHEPDFTVTMSSTALENLVQYSQAEGRNLADLALYVLQGLLSKDQADALHLHLNAGVFQLWQHGYFSLALVGGKPVANFLAAHGLKSVTAIMELLKKMRKS